MGLCQRVCALAHARWAGRHTPSHAHTHAAVLVRGIATTQVKGSNAPKEGKTLSLAQVLKTRIQALGPMSVADYMRACLTSGLGGYYTSKESVFGQEGDFITSPEISQVFGELLAVWFVYQWKSVVAQNPKFASRKIELVELGPGKGTLMADMLRSIRRFDDIFSHISVSLVEASPLLCLEQEALLSENPEKRNPENGKLPVAKSGGVYHQSVTKYGNQISWYRTIDDLPSIGKDKNTEIKPENTAPSQKPSAGSTENTGKNPENESDSMTFLIAHEFLDALPIHQFEYTKRGWRERYVGLDENENFCFVLAPAETLAGKAFIPENLGRITPGTILEVCPEAQAVADTVAQRVAATGGSALFVDYGDNAHILRHTLRGYCKHTLIDRVLETPGEMDLTADVDFKSLARACMPHADVHGPMEQGQFLMSMGIQLRLKQLLQKATPEQQSVLYSNCLKLVSPKEMGQRFKFLAVCPKGSPPPPGFQPPPSPQKPQ